MTFYLTIPAFRLSTTMFSTLKLTSVVAMAGLEVTVTILVGRLVLLIAPVFSIALSLEKRRHVVAVSL